MKRLFTLLATAFAVSSFGQRYLTPQFTNVDKTADVSFGQAPARTGFTVDLKMDIYEPSGDTQTNRPLMVLAHGGSFVAGNRTDLDQICSDYAKMGYVTATVSYRLGINTANISGLDEELLKAATRAIQDYSAALRYFYKSARDEGNPYNIDTNRIIAGGVSAGSIAAIHSQLFWDETTASAQMQGIISSLGGITGGNNGSPGYPNRAIGLWDVVGAILDTSMVNSADVSCISFHGDADQIVPYGVGFATFNGLNIVQMHGSFVLQQKLVQMNAPATSMNSYAGVGHNIFNDPVRTDSIFAKTTRFFYTNVVNNPSVGIDDQVDEIFGIYPNPISGNRLIVETNSTGTYRILDILGKDWMSGDYEPGKNAIDISTLPKGVYLLIAGGKTHRILRQ